jgi:hypothetical protein
MQPIILHRSPTPYGKSKALNKYSQQEKPTLRYGFPLL